MTTKTAFNVLLSLYHNKKKRDFTPLENLALIRAISVLAAAMGLEDWDWGHN